MKMVHGLSAAALLVLGGTVSAAADQQAAIDGCIDQLRTVGGPDAAGGEVIGKEWSEAGNLITLRDAGGTIWECIAYDDGAVGDLRVVEATDDGGGAMVGADDGGGATARAPSENDIRVKFAPGTTGATYSAALGSGDAVHYTLGAQDGQFLTVELSGNSDSLNYIIYVPSGDILDESSQSGYRYSGQLYQSGDHVVEVFYNGDQGTTGSYDISFEIK